MSLWVITSYFNPAGYQRRKANYAGFRKHLNAPLAAVELSFNGEFELQKGDADILVQLQGTDVMWQKERLLNIALESLPSDCEAVAWVDADVVFESEDWPQHTLKALERFNLVQVFSERHDAAAGVGEETIRTVPTEDVSGSLGAGIERGLVGPENLPSRNTKKELGMSIGVGWASRREILEEHRFYDACIVGGGDRVMTSAGLGAFESATRSLQMNARRKEHYERWALPFHDAIGGSIGHVPGRLFHFWHGRPELRQYDERDRLLADFDPYEDIALDARGCWRWASDKPELHAGVREYFASRREDGE